jgi:hypothetical protein
MTDENVFAQTTGNAGFENIACNSGDGEERRYETGHFFHICDRFPVGAPGLLPTECFGNGYRRQHLQHTSIRHQRLSLRLALPVLE